MAVLQWGQLVWESASVVCSGGLHTDTVEMPGGFLKQMLKSKAFKMVNFTKCARLSQSSVLEQCYAD